jgi:hypothetical protein
MRVILGTRSCSSPSRFDPSSVSKLLTPVTLPPGRLKLATRPNLIGSPDPFCCISCPGVSRVWAIVAAIAPPPSVNQSGKMCSWKDRKAILPAIKAIYRAENADMALVRLEEFEAEWGKRYPAIGQIWRRA